MLRTFIIGLVIFLAYLLFARWYFVCQVRHQCGEPETVEVPRAETLALWQGDSAVISGYEQMVVGLDSIRPDLNASNHDFLQAVADYFSENEDQDLTVTGNYLRAERFAPAGFFENVGIARAAYLERLLQEAGMDPKRIYLDHHLVEADSLEEPIYFSIPEKADSKFNQLQFSFRDMTYSDANFAYNSAEFTPGSAFIAYADSVVQFLADSIQYQLSIIGHTDSIASEAYNKDLGYKRAEAAREYFKEKGVESDILVSSMGEDEPVAPNTLSDGTDNPEGRQKNRRVNFKIQPFAEPAEDDN
jgi:outer membrane protein OmpA-like peptidoglycan-associated protein